MKKVRWIIQENDIADNDIIDIQKILEKNGIKYHFIKYIPFTTVLPDFPIDDEYENVYYGGTSLMNTLYKNMKPRGLFYNHENYSMEKYLDKWGDKMFNHGATVMSIGSLIKELSNPKNSSINFLSDNDIFIRPNGDGKEFNGTVTSPEKAKNILKGILHNDANINEDFPVLAGKAWVIKQEWRLLIVNGKVITSSQYVKNQRLAKEANCPKEVVKFAEDRASEYHPHEVFVMDICSTNQDELFILECGCANSVGFYHMDKEKFIMAINDFICP